VGLFTHLFSVHAPELAAFLGSIHGALYLSVAVTVLLWSRTQIGDARAGAVALTEGAFTVLIIRHRSDGSRLESPG